MWEITSKMGMRAFSGRFLLRVFATTFVLITKARTGLRDTKHFHVKTLQFLILNLE